MGPGKTRPRRNGVATKGGAAERGPERSEDRKCPLRFVAAVFRIPRSTASDSGGDVRCLLNRNATVKELVAESIVEAPDISTFHRLSWIDKVLRNAR